MRALTILCLLFSVGFAAPPDPSGIEGALFEALRTKFVDLSAKDFFAELPDPRFKSSQDFDPTEAAFFERVSKNVAIKPVLKQFKQQGFVQVDGGQRYSMGSMYQHIYMQDMPVLITTDSILHALHRSYDELLISQETHVFLPAIRRVLMETRDALIKPGESEPTEAQRDAELYLTVALNLLRGAGGPKEGEWGVAWDGKLHVVSVLGQDEQVLALLKRVQEGKLEKERETLIYGAKRAVDWSQFKPRGHYTQSPKLRMYFRAMMWLGRADTGFVLMQDRERRAATTLALALRASGQAKRLKAVSSVIDFMVGQADDLGVPAFMALLEQVGIKGKGATGAQDAELKEQLVATGLGAQRIRSQLLVAYPGAPKAVVPPALFQLFGQRFLIDSFALSKVVFDSIVYKGERKKRLMPKGLDVMAALGNDQAARRLGGELERWQYGANLKALRGLIEAYPKAAWGQSLYWQWLGALRTLDDVPADRQFFPQAMQTEAWQNKMLITQLGSWAELRHDTILYGKQSYTSMSGCEYPTAYVEPYPEFYQALGAFAERAATGLGAADLSVPGRHVAYFSRFGQIMGRLEGLAQKELEGTPFTKADLHWLRKTIDKRGVGSGPPRYDGWYTELFYGTTPDKWVPTVSDVHTDPNSGEFLEVAVGDAQFLVVAIDNDGDRAVYVGPSFSYYEFVETGSRLTDGAWRRRIYKGKQPPAFR